MSQASVFGHLQCMLEEVSHFLTEIEGQSEDRLVADDALRNHLIQRVQIVSTVSQCLLKTFQPRSCLIDWHKLPTLRDQLVPAYTVGKTVLWHEMMLTMMILKQDIEQLLKTAQFD